jgi:quinol monooxygenase YgiN
MQYTHVATLTTKSGQLRDLLRKIEAELLPAYRGEPGFVAYTIAKTGESSAVAFGIWQTRQQAEQSIKTSDQWMKDGIGKLLDTLHNRVGELPFLAFSSDLGVYSSPTPVAEAHA